MLVPFNTLQKIIPDPLKKRISTIVRAKNSANFKKEHLLTYNYLKELMSNYQLKNLVNTDAASFKNKIEQFLQLKDYKMEDFKDTDVQRDFSIKFHWGHDHDFGDFSLKGMMGDRHISLLCTFMDDFNALPKTLKGLKVLDIGCWTGGTSLLLNAMGAEVLAIEEVKKYVDCLEYIKQSFNLKNFETRNLSLYECAKNEFYNRFDIVLFAGVLYHLTDPVLALRITFDCLKDGGICLLETAVEKSDKKILSYKGPTEFTRGTKKELNRQGWNWFFPSPKTLSQMMSDVGYEDILLSNIIHGRAFAVGKRKRHVDMMRSGLSVRGIF